MGSVMRQCTCVYAKQAHSRAIAPCWVQHLVGAAVGQSESRHSPSYFNSVCVQLSGDGGVARAAQGCTLGRIRSAPNRHSTPKRGNSKQPNVTSTGSYTEIFRKMAQVC